VRAKVVLGTTPGAVQYADPAERDSLRSVIDDPSLPSKGYSPERGERAAIGSAGERHGFVDAEPALRREGYTEIYFKDSWPAWARRAFPGETKTTEVLAIDPKRSRVLVEDITAGPWSGTEMKAGHRLRLPQEDPGRLYKSRRSGKVVTPPEQKVAHLEKTVEDGHQVARNLPPELEHYEVVVRDRYWDYGGVSREITVKPAAPIGGVGPTSSASSSAASSPEKAAETVATRRPAGTTATRRPSEAVAERATTRRSPESGVENRPGVEPTTAKRPVGAIGEPEDGVHSGPGGMHPLDIAQSLGAVGAEADRIAIFRGLRSEQWWVPGRLSRQKGIFEALRSTNPEATIYAAITYRFRWTIPRSGVAPVVGFMKQVFQSVSFDNVEITLSPHEGVVRTPSEQRGGFARLTSSVRIDLVTYSVPIAEPGEDWSPKVPDRPIQVGLPLWRLLWMSRPAPQDE
jgi:hypothetical protein